MRLLLASATLALSLVATQVNAQTHSKVDYWHFQMIRVGLPYEIVSVILGGPGREVSATEFMRTKSSVVSWVAPNGYSNITIMFVNNKAMSKAEFGLNN